MMMLYNWFRNTFIQWLFFRPQLLTSIYNYRNTIKPKTYRHYNTPLEAIIDNLDKDWHWEYLSANPNITWQDVVDHPQLPWNWSGLSVNPTITWEIIQNNPDAKWDFSAMVNNPNITREFIRENPGYPWDFAYHDMLDEMEEHRRRRSELLCRQANVLMNGTETEIKEQTMYILVPRLEELYGNNFTTNKVYALMSSNEHITWEFVESQLDKPWRFDLLAMNAIVTYDIIEQYPLLPWSYSALSRNPNITWEIIQDNPTKPWDYCVMSQNPNITWEIVKNHPEKPWDYWALSRNSMNYRQDTQLSYVLK